MQLKTRVKVSHVTNLHEARYCAGMGVEMIGFPLTGQRALEADTFTEITSWLAGVSFVAEVDAPQALTLPEGVAYLEVPASLLPQLPPDDETPPLVVRLTFRAVEKATFEQTLAAYAHRTAFFLVESEDTLSATNCTYLAEIAKKYPIFIGFGLDKENVLHVLAEVQPAGIALYPGEELQLGHNDFDALAEVLELLEEA